MTDTPPPNILTIDPVRGKIAEWNAGSAPLTVIGEHFVAGAEGSKVFLLDDTGEEHELEVDAQDANTLVCLPASGDYVRGSYPVKVVNPDGLVNQIEGGIVQATSWTLKEAVAFSGDRVVTDSWSAYPILAFSEVPEIQVELIDHPELPPLGSGETSVGPTAAAIGNAVRRALGVRVPELPITREAVMAASV